MKERTYYCIDMKTFFASVECAERGLNPFETNLVVADETRGRGALCLAVSPKMKSLGVKNRCRIFEIPQSIKYIVAKPRMKKYIEYAADIYELYLQYISPEDIHVYSIDESFIDVTEYLNIYRTDGRSFAKKLMNEIAERKRIPATAGVGSNLYLAKIALDITAKKCPEHIGYLDEELYRQTLWQHRPLTDFWQIGRGTVNRLARYCITTMEGIARAPEELLYRLFGINAELLIDHAWGRESCTMADIKNYRSQSKSISNSQILFEDYTVEKAKIVLDEMILGGCQEMMRRKVVAGGLSVYIGYSNDGEPSSGRVAMTETTSSYSLIVPYADALYEKIVNKEKLIRHIGICFDRIVDESCAGYDMFTDYEKVTKERKIEQAVLELKNKFGKNAMIRGIDLQDGATAMIRNKLIGGHNGE